MQQRNDSKPVPVISHKEISAEIPSISKDVGNQDHVHYKGTNQSGVDMSSATVIVTKNQPIKKPKDFVNFSCFVILGCNCIFGFLGYHYGQKSNYAWQLGDVYTAKKQAKKALIFNVIGIVFGILTYILAIVLFFLIFKGQVPVLKHHAFG